MTVEVERRSQAQATEPAELCLLLIRAPADREIYAAFRALAAQAQDHSSREQLIIEGDVPLTAGLSTPSVPATVQRLLDADCDMIDNLSLQIGELCVTYVRSGGHAPFRESFFDEVRLEAKDASSIDSANVEKVLEILNVHLAVVSHTVTGAFADLIAQRATRTSSSTDSAPPLAAPIARPH